MPIYVQTKRSLTKAITFRALILCSDTIVIFLITHRWETTAGLVIATNLASTTLYFIHERIWNRIQWGRAYKGAPDLPSAPPI
jgi:adenylylsulfate kinase